jgi:predicted CXXCH cytochrome family protein
MRVLIRRVTRKASGVERSDTPFDGEEITVGRAADRDIHLADRSLPLEHSVIVERSRGQLGIRAEADTLLFVNGGRVQSAALSPGDFLEVGGSRLVVSDPLPGYDHVILVEAGEAEVEEVPLAHQFVTTLEESGLSRRRWSWVLGIGILVACLGVPLAGAFSADLAKALRATPAVPDDGQWDSGPLHASHRFIGEDCSACHRDAFTMVPDERCVACHTFVEHHVGPDIQPLADLDERRCASCHREHNEPSALVRADQALCTDCHADLATHAPDADHLRNVSDFFGDHPEFRVTTLVPSGQGTATTWAPARGGLDDDTLQERSNLKFPHDVHLDAVGIESPRGDVVLECRDCHRPDPAGAYMEPVTMEKHCGVCHRLQFDAADPAREVPHGDPEVVLRTLEEFYSRQFLNNQVDLATGGAAARAGRRPGASTATQGERALALAWARDQAQSAAGDLFERRTCKDCHEISVSEQPDRLSKWQVNPVRLTRVWMPKSFFNHRAHETYECAECHAAETSSEAGDVLMPKVAVCRDCHGGERADNLLNSTCIECHRFHLPGLDVMKPGVPGAQTRPQASDLEQRLEREGT